MVFPEERLSHKMQRVRWKPESQGTGSQQRMQPRVDTGSHVCRTRVLINRALRDEAGEGHQENPQRAFCAQKLKGDKRLYFLFKSSVYVSIGIRVSPLLSVFLLSSQYPMIASS